MAYIAHVGYGYWGRNIARNLADLGLLAAVIDPDPKAAAGAADALGVRAATFEAALSDSSIDGMTIASPAEMHFTHAKAALEAGKNVFVEKPLALEIAQAEALCDLAQRKGLKLMVGHLLQYHPIYIRLKEMVLAGEFGALSYVYSNRLSLGKFRREENVLWSFAPHDISMILGLFGSEPNHVTAQGSVAYTQGVADIVTMQMHFPHGSAHVLTSWMHPFKEQRLVVVGETGMAVFEDSEADWASKLKVYRHRIDTSKPVPTPEKAEAEVIAVPKGEPLREECRHFAECIDCDRTPRTDGHEGLRVLRVLDKAERELKANLQFQTPAG